MNSNTRSPWRAKLPRHDDNASLRNWLLDRGSLTARIQTRGRFSLSVAFQGPAKPFRDEASILGIKPGVLTRTREVILYSNGEPLVFAHTILPYKPRGPLGRWLARLGTRSLGALLFSSAVFTRGAIYCRPLGHQHPLYRRAVVALAMEASPPETLWARRSRFSFGKQSVLVTEVFSPALKKQACNPP